MSSRSAKRKRYSDIKNMLVNDLHKLTIDSGDVNNELLAANEDFVLMFKSMEDRMSQQLTLILLIEEKIRDTTAILKDDSNEQIGESSARNLQLPSAYRGNLSKFVDDSSTSLAGHAKMLSQHVEEMFSVFQKNGDTWKNLLHELKGRAEKVMEETASLGHQLSDFVRNV